MSQKNHRDETELIAEAFSSLMSGADNNQQHIIQKAKKRARTSKTGQYKILGAVLMVLIFGAGAIFGGLQLTKNSNPDTQQSEVLGQVTTFTPYNTTNLPAELSVEDNSTAYESGVLFTTIKTIDGQSISLTQQPLPKEFAGSIPSAGESIETPYGKGAISSIAGRTTINIISEDEVFILISAPSTVNTELLRQLAQSLKR